MLLFTEQIMSQKDASMHHTGLSGCKSWEKSYIEKKVRHWLCMGSAGDFFHFLKIGSHNVLNIYAPGSFYGAVTYHCTEMTGSHNNHVGKSSSWVS